MFNVRLLKGSIFGVYMQIAQGSISGASSSSLTGAQSLIPVVEQSNPSVQLPVQHSSPASLDPDDLIPRKRSWKEFVDRVDLTKDDSPDQYHLPPYFL